MISTTFLGASVAANRIPLPAELAVTGSVHLGAPAAQFDALFAARSARTRALARSVEFCPVPPG